MLRTLGVLALLSGIAWSAVAADELKEKPGKTAPHAIKPGAKPTAEAGTGRMVMVEVLIADMRRGDAAKDGPDATLEPKAQIEQWEKAGKLDALTRMQLTSSDGQPAFLQIGQRVPQVIGITATPRGQSNTVTKENVGLILSVTPQIRRDGLIAMAIEIQRSQLGPADEGPAIWKPNQGDPVRASAVETFQLQTTISARDGQSVIVGRQQARGSSHTGAVLVVVTARLLGNEPPSSAK
jgi:Flp pilus assembly secretin CpaC